MNVLISYKWLREYLDTKLSPEEFARLTTDAGNSVEYLRDVAREFDKMIVGKVIEIKNHPNADKLKIAKTKIGSKKTVEIVCGGENLAEGQKVIVALPGAKVRWHGEGELIELEEVEIRGVKSFGMICAANEIGFGKLPQGKKDIWDVSDITDATPGTLAAEALGVDDVIFDIEVTTNRPDCRSIIGQAREGYAITGANFDWQAEDISVLSNKGKGPEVKVDEAELCPKYEAVEISGVEIGPSPWWLQVRLLMAGFKPVNNVVDVTNYVLHEYGQPLHAFDADTLEGGIVVRKAKKGEKIIALDDAEYELEKNMLVIADQKKPVAIAGVIGGMETGTSEKTTRIIIESANFNSVSIRKTAMSLGIQTDSSQLFGKGLSTEATRPALERAVQLITEIAGGKVVGSVKTHRSSLYKAPMLAFSPNQANALMGITIPEEEMIGMLERLGFSLTKAGKKYKVTVPYWRDIDVDASVDFTEEIARLYGYSNIPSVLPVGEAASIAQDPIIYWERRVKEALRGAGLSESYSYSFISAKELEQYSIPLENAVKLADPLSEDHAYMRPTLIPSMLSAVSMNQHDITAATLFELAPVYIPNKKDIPDQKMRLTLCVYGENTEEVVLRAKGVLERLVRECGIRTLRLERESFGPHWHPSRSAILWLGDHEHVGMIGQIGTATAKAFDLDVTTAIIDIDFDLWIKHASTSKSYKPVPDFPAVKRDLAVVLDEKIEYAHIAEALKATSGLLHEVELFDVYQGQGVEKEKKSLAMHLSFRDQNRTLEAGEVDEEIKTLTKMLKDRFDGIIRS